MNRSFAFFLLPFFLGAMPAWGDAPKVVVSVKPIHALVAGVMHGVAQPRLLIRGNASPHAYALRPSDARHLHHADVLFWVGAALETFLVRIVKNLPKQTERVALLAASEIQRLPNRAIGFKEASSASPARRHKPHQHDKGPYHESQHGQWDPHIWLAPKNAQKIVTLVGRVLSRRFPTYASQFQKNVTQMVQRLEKLDRDLSQLLMPVRDIPFLVYHDAYHYFEHHFGLHSVGSVTLNPDRPSGAKHIRNLRQVLKTSKAACLFTEPQFHAPIIQTILEDYAIKVGTLDPLGVHLEAGTEHYFQLMHTLANDLMTCLTS